MKKIFSLIFVAFVFSSCTKCQDCTCDSLNVNDSLVVAEETEVCRDDFASNDDYNEAIASLELLGCSCN